MKQAACCLFLAFSFFLFPLGLGQAEHTPDHRFRVYGYVYDDAGSPQPGLVVVKDRADNILGTTVAGSSSYYQIRLHLHNSDLGKKLFIDSKAGQKDLIVKFDPDNTTTERMAEVNFGKVPPSSGLGTYTLLGGSTLLLAAVIYAFSRKRKSRKQPHGKKKRR